MAALLRLPDLVGRALLIRLLTAHPLAGVGLWRAIAVTLVVLFRANTRQG
jgi:hypothetical protein